ncbi:MAG: putative S-adenosylmethionine-dependent methyltransferase [Frankiales bacterium]|nr:putative S-adenosylmethionine-dependent methyltransferase [Frankiales bacterium]
MDDSVLDAFAAWERDSWEVRAAAYAADVGVLTRGAVPALLDAAAVGSGCRVLDVATGPGFVGTEALGRGAVVTAVDQSAAMVEIASRALPDVRQASAEQLGLPDGAYDAVVAGFLLNHLARPELGIAELVRVLAPGGRLALTVWDRPDANRAMGLLGEVVTSLGITGVVPPGPDSTLFADEQRFAALLAGGGLVDVEVARMTWQVDVEPGGWFDTVAAAMPRSGAVLASANEPQRAQARQVYVERALERYGSGNGRCLLPATAVVGSGRRP